VVEPYKFINGVKIVHRYCLLHIMLQILENSDYQFSQILIQNKKEEEVLQKLKKTCAIP